MQASEVVSLTTKAVEQNLQMQFEHLFNLEGRIDLAKELLYYCELDEEEMSLAQNDLTECRDELCILMNKVTEIRLTIQRVHDRWA